MSRLTLNCFDIFMAEAKLSGVQNSFGSVRFECPCIATAIWCFSANGTTRLATVRFVDAVMMFAPSARVIFAIDATASRQSTWDLARHLTGDMFKAVVGGSLSVQCVYFRGDRECIATPWTSNASTLSATMADVECRQGLTQIQRVLEHTKRENERQKVAALVLISDSCEEQQAHLYAAARALCDVPVFLFQEGSDEHVAHVATAEAVGQALVIDAQEVKHRRVEVVDFDFVLDGVIAVVVGRAVDRPPFDPRAGQPHREPERIVVAPVGPLGHRRPAELASPQDKRLVQQPA